MKWIKNVVAIIVLICLLIIVDNGTLKSLSSTNSDNVSLVDEVVFPHDEVVDVFIEIDETIYQEMNENAMNEEVVMADITYNGYTFSSIGIRPKGNSSLKSVANSESDRYSFKVDFDYYLDDQSFYGITKINLNNLFSDPTMMAEYLGYEMMSELDLASSRTTYVSLYINGEYFGLYLAVEQVNDTFLQDQFGNANGELYKPEMGTGSNLEYTSDNGLDYTGLFPENFNQYDNDNITELMKVISEGGDLESVMNVDSFLKYLAVSTVTIHLDAYQGGMYHNYYLYNNNGIFEWIPWDLNMIFNGFPMSGLTDEEAIGFLIDEPVNGSIEKYPLVQAVFESDEYVARYHEYIEILMDGYLSQDQITEKITETYQMIKGYVELDSTSFYTYQEFEEALFTDSENNISLLTFIQRRLENIEQQLDGTIPSTNNGEGNTGTGGKSMDRMNPGGMGQGGMQGGMRPEGMKGEVEGGMQGRGMRGAEQGEIQGAIPDDMQGGMQDVMLQGLEGGLPPGINMEDIPEEIREYIERGEMPPMDMMMEFMDQMPEDMKMPMGGMPQMKGNEVTSAPQVESNNISILDAALIGITALIMIGSTIYLSKKHV